MVARLDKKPTPSAPSVKKADPKVAAKAPAPQPLGRAFARGGDSLSTGRGGALRQNAARLLGATGLSSNAPLAKAAIAHRFDGGGSLDPAVAAAARDAQAAWASSTDPKVRDRAVLEGVKAGAAKFANDPILAAQYASAIAPLVTSLAADLGARKDDQSIRGLLEDLGGVATQLGPEATLTLGAAIARGLPNTKDLFYVDDALRSSPLALSVLVGLTDQGKLDSARNLLASTLGFVAVTGLTPEVLAAFQAVSPALAGPLSVALQKLGSPVLASIFGGVAFSALGAATAAADEANQNVAQLQSDLNEELQHVPQADRHAYEQLFWQEHQGALDAASTANAALQTELSRALPQLKQLALAGNEDAAKLIEKSLTTLSRDPAQADFVSSTIEGLKVNGAYPRPLHEQALVDAYSAAKQGKANLLLATGDTAGAAAVLDEVLSFLETTQFVTTGIAELKKPLEHFVEVLRTGDPQKITDFLTGEGEKDVLALSKSSQALGAFVTGLSVAVTLVKAIDAGIDFDSALKTLFETTGPVAGLVAQGLEVLAGAVNSAALQTKLTSAAEFAGLLEKGLGKITAVVGVVTGVIDTIGSVRDVIDDPNIQSVGAAAGSLITTLGGALSLFPGANAVGGAVVVLGTAVTVLSNYIAAEEAADDRADETAKLLEKLFADPNHPASKLSVREREALAEHLSTTTVDLDALQQQTGLTDAQLYALGATTNALSFESAEGWSLGDVASALGLKGQAFIDFLKTHDPSFIDQVGGWTPTGAQAFDTYAAVNEVRAKHPGWSDQQVHDEVQRQRAAWRETQFDAWVREVAGTTKKR